MGRVSFFVTKCIVLFVFKCRQQKYGVHGCLTSFEESVKHCKYSVLANRKLALEQKQPTVFQKRMRIADLTKHTEIPCSYLKTARAHRYTQSRIIQQVYNV